MRNVLTKCSGKRKWAVPTWKSTPRDLDKNPHPSSDLPWKNHLQWPGPIRAHYMLRLASDTPKRRPYRAPFYKVLNSSLFLKTDDFTEAHQGVRKPTSLQKQSHVHRKNKGCQNASMGLQRALYEAWFGRILANGGWICVILKIFVKFCLLWFFKDIFSCIFPEWVSFLSIG